ncbi:hypothetical protein FACS189428_7330 [Clostridia bacterium]|nr:hypothetical protein FACS189428_7330 [Clostridia bacterium]
MVNSADVFLSDIYQETESYIRLVMKYIIYCYKKMITDKKTYDYSRKGKINQEEFLRNGLVDDYLTKKSNKEYYIRSVSGYSNVKIYFQAEERMSYSDGVLRDDYIDISIKATPLSEIWGDQTEDEIKFAIECKRINKHTDYNKYKKDIDKFIARPHTTFRLPFEGQIAFLENKTINHTTTKDEVNKLLHADNQYLVSELAFTQLEENIDYSYSSKHKRSYQPFKSFSIFHLFLDYSAIVINQ